MINFTFDRTRCEHFIDAIKSGAAIQPTGAGWSGEDLVTLAGACLASAFDRGSAAWGPTQERRSREHAEAIEDSFLSEVQAAIGLVGLFTCKLMDGDYDREYETVVQTIITATADGAKVQYVRGQKQS